MRRPPFDATLDRVRYAIAAAWYRPLRGSYMRLGQGVHISMANDVEFSVGEGFRARADLTLSIWGQTQIGVNCICNRGVFIASAGYLRIGDNVRIGERVSVLDHGHVLEPLDDRKGRVEDYVATPTVLGDRVMISANCVILPGANIGADALIAAGSVVRGEIPPRTLAAGAPAVVKRELA